MSKQKKYQYLTLFQVNYGGFGWEDLAEAKTKSKNEMKDLYNFAFEAKMHSKNMNAQFRYIERRVLNEE